MVETRSKWEDELELCSVAKILQPFTTNNSSVKCLDSFAKKTTGPFRWRRSKVFNIDTKLGRTRFRVCCYIFKTNSVSPLNFVPLTHRVSLLTRSSFGKRCTRAPIATLASARASCRPMH
jgi:hypothetical protein